MFRVPECRGLVVNQCSRTIPHVSVCTASTGVLSLSIPQFALFFRHRCDRSICCVRASSPCLVPIDSLKHIKLETSNMPATAVSLVTGLLPGLDSDITRYISGIWDEQDEDISEDDSEDGLREFVRPLLEGEGVDEEEINAVIEQIRSLRPASPGTSSSGAARTAKRLDKAIDMKNNPSISFTASLAGPVDIESTTKGRNTQVDLKKLEKAEAKIKAKMEKRARRTVEFEGSKLVDAAKAQKAYEEMYMTVNPLQNHALNKGKSKDIALEAIDVSYGSNQILSNAS